LPPGRTDDTGTVTENREGTEKREKTLAEKYADVMALVQKDPSLFATCLTQEPLEKWSAALMRLVWKYPKVAAVCCNGAGKTFTVARTIAAFLLAHPRAVVVITSASWGAVRWQVFKEIAATHRKLPPWAKLGTLNTVDWQITPEWYAIGLSVKEPGRFEGFHGPYILIVIDEAKTVPQGIFDAANRIRAGNSSSVVRFLQVSSPGVSNGPHYAAFHDNSENWVRLMVSPFEAWYQVPGEDQVILPPTTRITPGFIEEMRHEYGEESPIYRSMVLAKWTEDAEGAVFTAADLSRSKPDWVEKSQEINWKPGQRGDVWVGADVARSEGGDESVFYAIQEYLLPGEVHYRIMEIEPFRTRDSQVYEDRLIKFMSHNKALPEHVNVDGVGIGGPVCDSMRRKGYKVNEIGASSGPTISTPAMKNLRAEIWWTGANKARSGMIHNLFDDRTIAQLHEPIGSYDSSGKFQVESKEAVNARLSRTDPNRSWKSPDRADALLLAIYRPFRVAPSWGAYVV